MKTTFKLQQKNVKVVMNTCRYYRPENISHIYCSEKFNDMLCVLLRNSWLKNDTYDEDRTLTLVYVWHQTAIERKIAKQWKDIAP